MYCLEQIITIIQHPTTLKKLIIPLVLFLFFFQLSAQKNPIYKDKNAPIESRIKDLVSRMTLEEKVLQLNQFTVGYNNNVNKLKTKI